MKMFDIFKKHTEVVEEVITNGMERFDGSIIDFDDDFVRGCDMPSL